ncbi:MAG: hypothetical protein BWK80_30130 [Desulfobacteraceae bacterium IS3]|nr:MAG: hypothetical protein BWK80_30130 [Desulfobacteraceae bacterium IS3]
MPEGSSEVYLRRPLILKRVLEVLDKVTIESIGYVPELVIGGEGDAPSEETMAALKKAADEAKQTIRSGFKARCQTITPGDSCGFSQTSTIVISINLASRDNTPSRGVIPQSSSTTVDEYYYNLQ